MKQTWRVGDWRVNLDAGWLRPRHRIVSRRTYPDGRVMTVLGVLIAKPGELVSTDQILAAGWPNRVVTPDSVRTAIYQLRQLLGDSSSTPTYIRTEPRRGYRLIAPVVALRRNTWQAWATATGAVGLIGMFVFAELSETETSPQSVSPQLYVAPLTDATGDPDLEHLSVAIDATLISAVVRRNPGNVAARHEDNSSPLRMESQVVACAYGPALVVRLLDVEERRYFWSKYYPLYGDSSEPTVVELAARDVTEALAKN